MGARSFYYSAVFSTCLSGQGFLPINDLSITPLTDSGLSQEQYETAIAKVERVYRPLLRNLVVKRLWDDPTVNAGTYIDSKTQQRIINIYGGIARHPLMTLDGLSLVVCHEVGHHLGGVPRKTDDEMRWIWAATEGQSDYFATLKYLRKVFGSENNSEAIQGMAVPAKVKTLCGKSFSGKDKDLCIRTSVAGLAVANVMADTQKKPLTSFETPDATVTPMTVEFHPAPQCRLDTYFQGSLCTVDVSYETSQTNELPGSCNTIQGFKIGTRPLCWFRPSPNTTIPGPK